jgi:rubrerythrin
MIIIRFLGMHKFIKMLQRAHAGELAAYHAYEGHWRSLSDPQERGAIKLIQDDELDHIRYLEIMLDVYHAQPSKIRDFIFTLIGKSASLMCYMTGWYLPMYGARFIENIGAVNYNVMSNKAKLLGLNETARALLMMGEVEKRHEDYFLKVMNEV